MVCLCVGGSQRAVLCRVGRVDVRDQREAAADRGVGTVAAQVGHHETSLRGETGAAAGTHPRHAGRTRSSPRRVTN